MPNTKLTKPEFLILIALIFWFSSFETCSATDSKQWKKSRDASLSVLREKGNGYGGMSDHLHRRKKAKQGVNSTTFNVLDYGAKGDGKTDDTKAFQAAWTAACGVKSSIVMVPSGSVFLVGPTSFSGAGCQTNITFQIDGKIIAPTESGAWRPNLLQWILFDKLTAITINGKGIIDGQGSVLWWNDLPTDGTTGDSIGSSDDMQQNSKLKPKKSGTKPTALRFHGSTNVVVRGVTIQNSPQTHLKFDNCMDVQVSDFTTSSPGDSPNTDGIHLQNTKNVAIYSTNLSCGDDCVSIQTGCSNIDIHNVNCGPGHGISIGGLGYDNTKACVSSIIVRDVVIHNTLTGVRIKTWQGGSGSVKQVTFQNITVSEVETPIMIDQFYCDKKRKCTNQTSAVAVSDIIYQNIQGTYTKQPVHFACSDSKPCIGLSLSNIQLKPVQGKDHLEDPFCWKASGEVKNGTIPPVSCLQKTGNPSKSGGQPVDSC